MHQPDFHQRWIEINSDALTDNVRVLKNAVCDSKLMAVVKANGYGHDAKLVAPILRDAGADSFGVTTLDEAIAVVGSSIDASVTPILCFAPITDMLAVEFAIESEIQLTVCDTNDLNRIKIAEEKVGKAAHLHLKIDTGMGRLGTHPNEALKLLKSRQNWAGVYTHFPNASQQNAKPTLRALREFTKTVEQARKSGVNTGICHCANSAGSLRFPATRLDMVRIGTALYGQLPTSYVPKPDGLRADTFAFKARVVQVRELRRGDTIGYGSEYRAKSKIRVAVIPVGFADGFGVAPTSLYSGLRGLKRVFDARSTAPTVKIDGQNAPVLGRVAMQMIVVDISGLSGSIEAGTIVDVPIRRLTASALIPRVLV